MTPGTSAIVVADANVLINLMHVARLDLCARIPGHDFVVPDHVREEFLDPQVTPGRTSRHFSAERLQCQKKHR